MYDALRELMKDDFIAYGKQERNAGIQAGMQAGMQAERQEMAVRMLRKQMTYDLIMDLTSLPFSKVQELSDSLHIPLVNPVNPTEAPTHSEVKRDTAAQ